MPTHTVKKQECLDSIASTYGILPKKIWLHQENESLRAKRRRGEVLKAGDSLFIPEIERCTERSSTDTKHQFRRLGNRLKFRLQLLERGEPRSAIRYRLIIDNEEVTGKADADGWIEIALSARAVRGKLVLADSNEEYDLVFGALDPADDEVGLQHRLANLGLYSGPLDGIIGPLTETAIAHFQAENGLAPSGTLDDQTRSRLLERARS